jgi:hypothetical protein
MLFLLSPSLPPGLCALSSFWYRVPTLKFEIMIVYQVAQPQKCPLPACELFIQYSVLQVLVYSLVIQTATHFQFTVPLPPCKISPHLILQFNEMCFKQRCVLRCRSVSCHASGLVVRVPGYRSRGRVRNPVVPYFLISNGSGTGSTQPREYN